MSRSEIQSKLTYHSKLAHIAWCDQNYADYAIESARMQVAIQALARLDREAAKLYDAIHNPLPETSL
jgi:hypothetical protein